MVIVNGRIAGVWRHEKKGGTVRVQVEAFETIPAWARRELRTETERLAAFLEGEPLLEFSD